MKIWIDADEWYPVFSAFTDERTYCDVTAELTPDEWEDYLEACERFNCWQERLGDLEAAELERRREAKASALAKVQEMVRSGRELQANLEQK